MHGRMSQGNNTVNTAEIGHYDESTTEMLRNRKKLPWKLGGGQSQGCPVTKKSIYYKKDSYLHVIVQINSRAVKL